MFEATPLYHRAPIGFGPAPGPRQDPKGNRFDWSESRATTVGVVYQVSRESVQALLPQGYVVDPQATPTVLFEVMELRNLPWLAGRGYNTWGVYFNDIVCERVTPAKKGSYLAVLFENSTDPITTGREELGLPKVWAELPDAVLSKDGQSRVHTASWLGFEFLRLEIQNLKHHDPRTAPAITRRSHADFTHPTQDGFLHHRYVPAVGEPGKADASYATFCPPPPGPAPVVSYQAPFQTPNPCKAEANENIQSTVKLSIRKGTFHQLPTLYNVVEGLASLELHQVQEVAVQTFQGASDLRSTQRIER